MSSKTAQLSRRANQRKLPYHVATIAAEAEGEEDVELYWKRPTRAEFSRILAFESSRSEAEAIGVVDEIAGLLLIKDDEAPFEQGIPKGYARFDIDDPLDMTIVYDVDVDRDWPLALKAWGFRMSKEAEEELKKRAEEQKGS